MEGVVRQKPDYVVPCPGGQSEQFFTAKDEGALGLHRTTISDAKPHFHAVMSEVYYVLEGNGVIWLDGVRHEVGPGTAIQIPPGVVHHGEGVYQVIGVYDHPSLHQEDTHHPDPSISDDPDRAQRMERLRAKLFDGLLNWETLPLDIPEEGSLPPDGTTIH